VMWQTFMTTLDYLEHSGKILITNDKEVIWIWDPEGVKEMLSKPHLRAR
jgi:hypothetical protein